MQRRPFRTAVVVVQKHRLHDDATAGTQGAERLLGDHHSRLGILLVEHVREEHHVVVAAELVVVVVAGLQLHAIRETGRIHVRLRDLQNVGQIEVRAGQRRVALREHDRVGAWPSPDVDQRLASLEIEVVEHVGAAVMGVVVHAADEVLRVLLVLTEVQRGILDVLAGANGLFQIQPGSRPLRHEANPVADVSMLAGDERAGDMRRVVVPIVLALEVPAAVSGNDETLQ